MPNWPPPAPPPPPPAPAPPQGNVKKEGKTTPDIFWNTWAEDGEDPRFAPVPRLKPNARYRLSLDLATLQYRAPGAVAVGIGQDFEKQVEKWIQPGMPPPTLKVLLLPDPGMFDARPFVQDLKVNVDRLRSIWKSGAVRADDDSFRKLKDSYPLDPDFKLGGTYFEVKTGSREGPAAAAFSIWYQDRPIDEVSVQFCIAETPETGNAKCGDMKNPVSPQGLASVRAASGSAAFPKAAIHFVALGEETPVTGVFRESAWEKDRFLVWQLEQTARNFRQTISEDFLQVIASGDTDENLLVRGETLFMFLFPKEATNFDGTKIHKHIRDFLRPYFQADPSAEDYLPPSIFVRMSQVGPSASLPIPLGLLALRLDETKEMTRGNGRFLGDYFRIESPLEVQTYASFDNCLSRWVMVLPPEDTRDDAIDQARRQLGETIDRWWDEKEALPFDRMTPFMNWMNRPMAADGEDPPTTLVTLSHHDRNSLYFYKKDSGKDNPLMYSMINRRFAQPSVAILNGCGTGGEGAVELIRRLNFQGFSAIVAASAEIDGTMAGAFLKVFADEIATGDLARRKTIGMACWRSIRRLSGTTPEGIPHARPFGAKAHLFSLLGNGEVPLCAPRKGNRPLTDR